MSYATDILASAPPLAGVVMPPMPLAEPPVDDFAVTEIAVDEDGNVIIDTPPDPPSSEKVKKALLEWHWTNAQEAKRQSAELRQRIVSMEHLYRGRNRDKGYLWDSDRAKRLNVDVELREAANQVDMMAAIFYDSAFQGSSLYRCIAINGESQRRANTTKSVVDSMLAEHNYFDQLHKLFLRYIKHPIAGLKTCAYTNEYEESVRRRFPINAPPGTLPQENSVMTKVGQDTDPEGLPIADVYDITSPKTAKDYYFEAVEMRRMLFPDNHRQVHDQVSLHELHYLTEDEIEAANFRSYPLADLADSNTTNQFYPEDISDDAGGGEANTNFPVWEVCESWGAIPFARLQRNGLFNNADLTLFCEEFEIEIDDLKRSKAKWQMFHIEDSTFLDFRPNYLKRKERYPYDFESFVSGDSELVGQSFLEGLADFDAFLQAMVNLVKNNLIMRLYMSVISSKRTNFKKEDLTELLQPLGFKKLEGNFDKIDDVLKFLEIPDLSSPGMAAINWILARMQGVGLPAVMLGEGGAETATQDALNNSRGQQKVNSAFRRVIMNVIVPQLQNILELAVMNFNESRWISMAGENGSKMVRGTFVSPSQVTNRLRIVPVATFDFHNRTTKATHLIGMTKVIGAVKPELIPKISALALQYLDIPQHEIDEALGEEGSHTEVIDEVKTLIVDPNWMPEVREGDNHDLALKLIDEAIRMKPELIDYPNVLDYRMRHFMLQQQQLMMMQMGGMGGPPGMPRRPQQGPPPKDEEGQVKQEAQMGSPPDTGLQTQTGETGTAANPDVDKLVANARLG